jgi:acetylcholinesterase
MTATADDLLIGTVAGLAYEQFPFRPVLDGPGGIVSDLPARRLSRGAGGRVPFIAGTVLDEGLFVSSVDGPAIFTTNAGTIFIPPDFQTNDISIWMNTNYTPSPLGADGLGAGVDKLISLYPDDPSAGSPFGTGNETFGTGPGFKRTAAICTSSSSSYLAALWKPTFCSLLTLLLVEDGDLSFQAPRRFLSQTALAPSYAYIFTDHQSDANPVLGVNHSSELSYLFGAFGFSGPPEHPLLSQVMLDYWISFAVSLTPNDGKGTSRASSYTSTLFCTYSDPVFRTSLGHVQRNQGTVSSLLPIGRERYSILVIQEVLELNSNAIGMIPDNYRADSIDVMIEMNETLSW